MDKMKLMVDLLVNLMDTFEKKAQSTSNHFDKMYRNVQRMSGMALGGDAGNSGGGTIMNQPNMTGGPGGPYQLQSTFASNAGRMFGATAFAAMQSSIPNAGTAITTDAATKYTAFYSGGRLTKGDVKGLQQQLNITGLPTSRTDAAGALLEAQRYGFTGQGNFSSQIAPSFADISRLTPGAGLTGGAQVMGTLNQARTVNMARMLGISVRDPQTGQPKPFKEVAEQIYKMIENGLGRRPTERDINSSLLPGLGLYNYLNDMFGNDELTKNTIIRYLLQKAKGGGLSSESLRETGAATFAQQSVGQVQGSFGQITSGVSPFIAGGIGVISKILMAILGPFANIFGGAREEGGPTKKGKAYIVGEDGPEIIVPREDGTVIPSRSTRSKGGPFDKPAWADRMLGLIGAPSSDTNIKAMVRWMNQEGGHSNNSAWYNPLNTTKKMPGELGVMNDHGVRQYADWEMGYEATRQTLSLGYYKAIVQAFKDSAPMNEIFNAIVTSKWGTKNLPTEGNKGLYSSKGASGGGGGGGYESAGGGSGGAGDAQAGSGGGGNFWQSAIGNLFGGVGTSPVSANYGGVNITINGSNLNSKDLVEEIKRQLGYENIMSIVGGS